MQNCNAAPLVAWVDQPEVQPTLPSSLLRLLIQLFKARGLACVVTVSASSVPQVTSIAETKPNPSQLPKQIGRLAQGPDTATENGNFSPLRSDITTIQLQPRTGKTITSSFHQSTYWLISWLLAL